ncbi:unnamed protein product [Calicophoron daubneyi]|uniref:PHD finger protein 10 n=1 Tax=Calicophoron daubneyi TaxID=300641 RepID=A0AAV2TDH9_CALDB
MVADACEFNRGLSKSRASRLPFMDLATQTSQRPAPWLYRTLCERSKNSIDGSAQVVLRYSRHRWRLATQPETKKRKLAADRLWLTLQSGLSALTIPSELVPLVTKRAYAIAGLPIPPGLATSLECVNPRGSSGLSSTNTNSNAYLSSGNRGHGSSALQKKIFASDGFSEHVKKIPAHEEEPPDVVDERMPEESEVPATGAKAASHKHRVSDLPTPTVSGEDSLQSTDMGGPKRPSNPNEDASPVNNRTDDEVSVQSGNGTKISSNSDGFLAHSAPKFDKTFEIEETEETDEDEEADVAEVEEDDVAEFGDDMDDDDVEWSQSGKTRRPYNSNSVSNNDGKFSNGRAYKSSARRQRSLSTHRGKRFSMVGSRLTSRRINAKRHLPQSQRSLSGRQKYGSGRRGSRTANSGNTSGAHGTPFGLPQQGCVLNKDKDRQDAWDNFDEPGFQPNANLNLLTDKNDESLVTAQRSIDEELSCNSSSYPPASPLDSSLPGHDSSYSGVRESGLNPLTVHQSPQLSVTDNSRRLAQNSLSVSSSTTPTSSYTVSPGSGSKQTMAQLLSSGSSGDPALPPPSSSCGFEYRRMIPPEMVASNRENDSSPLNSCNRRDAGSSSSQSMYSKEMTDSLTVNRNMDFQSSFNSRPSPARTVAGPETFAAPQGATTTVTFFVCEVCASRYRSTAGLRYHYHSQHSGYTPKNPISASASRLVVPVGEERGIGGGLRGGRPRRTKAGNSESRPKQKNKENDTKSFPSTPGPNEVTPGGTDSMDKYRENSAQIPSSMRPDSMPTFSPNYMGSSTINNTRPPCETPPRFASNMRSFARNPVNMNCVPGAPDSLISSKGMNSGTGGGGGGGGGNEEMWGNRSAQASGESNLPLTSVGVIPPPMNNPISSGMQNSEEMIDLLRAGSPKHLHTLQSLSSTELNTNSSSSGPRASPSRPSSATGPHPPISSYSSLPQMGWMQPPQQQPDPYGPSQSSQHSLPPSEHGQMFTPYRLTPNQRRYERQHCPDRLNLARPPPMTCIPTCVYCLGDDRLNQRLGRPEGLLRCCRCGQWAHFSCLRLPPHVLETAMHYPWQCIDCKTCWLCGSPDHENRMVFCGDCDRTFHVDCLPSPLARVPDGHWSCDICLHELYAMSKGPSDKFTSPMAPEMPYYAATVKDH